MNPLQRLELFLTGKAYVGHRRRPGWKGPLPFFAFKCPTHGIVEDYPHGYYSRLSCPICKAPIIYSNYIDKIEQEALLGKTS